MEVSLAVARELSGLRRAVESVRQMLGFGEFSEEQSAVQLESQMDDFQAGTTSTQFPPKQVCLTNCWWCTASVLLSATHMAVLVKNPGGVD